MVISLPFEGYHEFLNDDVKFLHAEFDALTGSKISSIDIGAPVVRMSYSPTSGHAVIAILEGLVCCIHLKRSQNKFLLIQKSILL
ncbi:hypothetical protein RGQ29_017422 [Quercus rubra]|uniref:Uncharacterized protein n=1 Tax=Quercus rubra TaxID=3512 RepID=A0AAN7FI23_QUERU|nr:hypothetical protein RGQ29_017422 [Quercus rubra]